MISNRSKYYYIRFRIITFLFLWVGTTSNNFGKNILLSNNTIQLDTLYVNEKLKSPKLFYPSSDSNFSISTETPTFKWGKVKNANGYTIYIRDIAKNKSIFSSSYYGAITLEQFTIPSDLLEKGKNYEIKMRSFNKYNWSEYSSSKIFNIKSLNKPESEPKKNLPDPTIISVNNLIIDTVNTNELKYKLVWSKIDGVKEYKIEVDGINSSVIFGEEYKKIISESVTDTAFTIESQLLKEFNNYRWRVKSKRKNEWGRFSNYNYFTLNDSKSLITEEKAADEIIMRLRYSGFIDEMIVVQYVNGKIYIPVIEILSTLQFNHKLDLENNVLTGIRPNDNLSYKLNLGQKKFTIENENILLNNSNYLKGDIDYYLAEEIIEKITGMELNVNMKNLTIELSSDFMLPMHKRILNEQKLSLYRDANSGSKYPLLYNRKHNYFGGAFFDYSATANLYKDQSPFYSLQYGIGTELFGGDFQIHSQQSWTDNQFSINSTQYKWRYAVLENNYISNIAIGNTNAQGLQSYELRGINISNQPIESRRVYGTHTIEEETIPNGKIEVYQNNRLIDIVESDTRGQYSFQVPFNYGTTFIELHEFGPNGEFNIKNKMYQIPVDQIPKGRLDYSLNFGELINSKENILQGFAAYGINDWLTTKLGTDLFTNDFNNSSVYNTLSARMFDGYIANLTIAPNAFQELTLNSIFTDLATFNIGTKLYQNNAKLNPSKKVSEYEGNVFVPFKIYDNQISFFFRGQKINFSGSNRLDLSLRTFYNYKSFSPSIELNYYNYQTQISHIKSTYLNFRLNYSLYIQSNIFTGNIIDSRLLYDVENKKVESLNFTLSTTLFHKFRVQISHTRNFRNSYSDTQLRLVFDLPFLRSSSSVSNRGMTQSIIGSIDYNKPQNDMDFFNRGMVGRSAATFKFFLDRNMNKKFDKGEKLVPDMDIMINSIGNKRRTDNGNIIIGDLQSYAKYDVKLIDRNNKNPLWFPEKEKFSFVSDPHQFKEIQIPFYEAAEVMGSTFRKVGENKIPLSGITIFLEETETKKITKIKSMSDGSFYHYGLKPGKYKIYPDNNQVKILGVNPVPEQFEGTINSISTDYLESEFNFIFE